MPKVYQEIPSNFSLILPYVITAENEIINNFFSDRTCIFYDTCSFIHHSQSINNKLILDYLKLETSVILITRTVLMELGSDGGNINQKQVDYFEMLHRCGFKIIIIDEEKIVNLMKYMIELNTKEANLSLGYAIKQVSKSRGAVSDLVLSLDRNIRTKLLGSQPGTELLYRDFFDYARSKKVSGDSLAEELILICIILLAKLNRGATLLVSDDLQIRSQIIDAQEYTECHYDNKSPIQLTTSRIVSDIYLTDSTVDTEKIKELLDCCFSSKTTVFFTTEFSLKIEIGTFSSLDLVNKMVNSKIFRVYY